MTIFPSNSKDQDLGKGAVEQDEPDQPAAILPCRGNWDIAIRIPC